jgi:hypothetical protein
MFNRIERNLSLRALMLAGLIMGSVTSTAFAAAPAHMASKDAQLSTRLGLVHSYSPGRANTGIQTSGPIFSRGYYVGQDPDLSIRFQLLRDGFYGTR